MIDQHISVVANELELNTTQVEATAFLLQESATVPFISRYRKEVTGSLDEVAITAIRDRLDQLAELDKRRDAVLKSLIERDLLTDELKGQVNTARNLAKLEDVYLPFRPKRRTRATMAREKGLEPLAALLLAQTSDPPIDPEDSAKEYIDGEKGVATADDALAGARDIIAEMVSEDEKARDRMRRLFVQKATIRSKLIKGKEEEGAKFKDWFDWEEPAARAPSHRVLAMRRGEKERFLTLRVLPPEEDALSLLQGLFVRGGSSAAQQVALAVQDSYKRLLGPSMEATVMATARCTLSDGARLGLTG